VLTDHFAPRREPRFPDDPSPSYPEVPRRRRGDDVTHLVLLDGRLVDAWTESADGGPWEGLRDLPPAPPRPVPDQYEETLAWLALVCGGWDALDALTVEPLTGDAPGPARTLHHPGRVAELDPLVSRVAEVCFDAETGVALRRAARLLDREDPDALAGARNTELLAGGICWLVGKANGWFGPPAGVAQSQVQHTLGLGSSITSSGYAVRRSLSGFGTHEPRSPLGMPDLLVLGCPELLVSRTRKALVRWRDHARGAHALAGKR
jgi:hypothetical protein